MENSIKIICVFFFLWSTVANKILVNDTYLNLMIPKYVSSLIGHISAQNQLTRHDVALIRLDESQGNSIYEELLKYILLENPNNPVYAHSSRETIPAYDVHASSFFVLVLDSSNLVSFLC